MQEYTVSELAKASGVSVRTLHYYDEIGLLKPKHVGANGYRTYGEAEFLRLQDILLFREFGVALKEIAALVNDAQADRLDRLRSHRAHLLEDAARRSRLLKTLDATIAHLVKEKKMEVSELYQGFTPEKQAEYEDWLVKHYGEDMKAAVEKSRSLTSAMTKAELEAKTDELEEVEAALVEAYHHGIPATSEKLRSLLERHRGWVSAMWGQECSAEAHVGLADMYQSHPDFTARFETLAVGFCKYLTDAIRARA